MNSLAHFYLVDIDNIDNKHHEFKYDFINIYDVNLPLPYQNKAIELFKEYIIKNNL